MAQVLLIAIYLLYITVHLHNCVTSMSQDIQIGLLYTYNMYTILTYRTHSPYWEVIMNTKLAPPIPWCQVTTTLIIFTNIDDVNNANICSKRH